MTTTSARAGDRPVPPSRQAARRATAVGVVGGVAAVGLGAGASIAPLALPALVMIPVALAVPLVAVLLAVVADGVVFPLVVAGPGATLLNIAVLGAVLAAMPLVLLRGRAHAVVLRTAAAVLALTATGTVAAVLTFPLSQVLSGFRYVVIPLAVAVLASTLTARALRMILRVVTVLMAVSLAAAIVETALGSDRLLEVTGLEYGTSIRNFGEALRAPGTFATNFHLGAYASVVAVVALLWWGTLEGARRDVVWRVVALVSALGSLSLSTYRTGVVLLVVAVMAAVLLGGDIVRPWIKAAVAVVGLGLMTGFLAVGLGSTTSLFQRLDIWWGLLADGPAWLGRGLGYAGAASGAEGAAVSVFTDNYYLSLWLQFGLPGLAIIGLLLATFVALLRWGRRGNRRAMLAACLWAGALVAFMFVELWEYTSAMSLIALVAASSVPRLRSGAAATSPGAASRRRTLTTRARA